jgi:hypothetical protein
MIIPFTNRPLYILCAAIAGSVEEAPNTYNENEVNAEAMISLGALQSSKPSDFPAFPWQDMNYKFLDSGLV